MQRLFSGWFRAIDRAVRRRFYAAHAQPHVGAPKLPRIEDVVASAGRQPPIAD